MISTIREYKLKIKERAGGQDLFRDFGHTEITNYFSFTFILSSVHISLNMTLPVDIINRPRINISIHFLDFSFHLILRNIRPVDNTKIF